MLMARDRGLDMRDFVKGMVTRFYSDDNIISDPVHEGPGMAADYQYYFARYLGIKLTSTDKGDDVSPCEGDIRDSEFLSRSFIQLPCGVVLPSLKYDSLVTRLYFVRVPRNVS